jgi:3-methylfumaryl-CoA hydratase
LPENLDWQEPCPIDPVKLFRFSAVTFNAHRIHYDFRYATQVEKYPGLVIHGPLQAMLLMRAANLRKLFLSGRLKDDGGLDLYTSNGSGHICMQAELSWHS